MKCFDMRVSLWITYVLIISSVVQDKDGVTEFTPNLLFICLIIIHLFGCVDQFQLSVF